MTEMIYNRTQNDVDESIRLIKEKVQEFKTLTESDIKVLEKGTITIKTINRIDDKMVELKELFNQLGYWNVEVKTYAEWEYIHIFRRRHFQTFIDNTNALRNAFFVYPETPVTPPVSYYFEDINALEKILYDLERMTQDIQDNYRECGNFECGEA